MGALILCLGVLGVVPIGASTQEEHPGREPYELVCQACHGEQGKGDVAPPLIPGDLDADYVLAIVREGYGQMPPISTRELTDSEIREVVAYLGTLNDQEPAASSGALH
jgi:mono/diheme cytochrome c family protein